MLNITLQSGLMSEDLAKRREKAKASHIGGVVESFYCNQDDGEYNNNPCLEQCIFCKETLV